MRHYHAIVFSLIAFAAVCLLTATMHRSSDEAVTEQPVQETAAQPEVPATQSEGQVASAGDPAPAPAHQGDAVVGKSESSTPVSGSPEGKVEPHPTEPSESPKEDKTQRPAGPATPEKPERKPSTSGKSRGKPRLALVIDDFGYNYKIAQRISELKLTATWAIIPSSPYSHKVAELAIGLRQPFIMHVPMQAISDPTGSKEYVVGLDTSEQRISEYVKGLRRDFPNALGVNNHRGSKATSDRPTMRRFMKALATTDWGFLDSRTFGKTIADQVAKEYDIPVIQNRCFIDGTPDLQTMKDQFKKALRMAEKYGTAVAICHAREKTLPFLSYVSRNNFSPVRFVTVDELWREQHSRHKEENSERQN